MSLKNHPHIQPNEARKNAPNAARGAGPDRPFKIEFPVDHAAPMRRQLCARAAAPLAAPLQKLLGVDRLNDVYDQCSSATTLPDFLQRVFETLHIRYRFPKEDLARIPKTGPLVVVSNHPFGAIDGMILASLLMSVRPDVKVMANYLLGKIPNLRDLFILVDPFGGADAKASNLGPMRQSIRWLKNGGCLAAFPAGEVAHLKLRDRQITDPTWNDTIARIVRHTGSPVMPVWFDGHNGPLFQVLGLVHPKLRTVLLPHALFKQKNTCVELRVGSPIPFKRLATIEGDANLTDYLRRRTFLLQHAAAEGDELKKNRLGRLVPQKKQPAPSKMEPVAPPVDPPLLAADIAALPPEATLVDHDDLLVIAARAPRIRNILRELGRLREETFRLVGEGTGRSLDLDTFDYDYIHLFIWNRVKREVVGAYRLGATDELLPAKGRLGLYTSTLFDYKAELLERISPALEMGRSFVRPEYQKSYAPLMLLWKGIGRFCVQNPRYRHLFGPVSISNNYQSVSKQLMVQFLKLRHEMPGGADLAQPRHPFRTDPPRGLGRLGRWDDLAQLVMTDADEVSALVAEIEPDKKGLPVLMRQYLKLGAKFLDFNVDPQFSDCLDGLIVVDLCRTEPRVLEKYMEKDGCASFLGHYGITVDRRSRAERAKAMNNG